MSMNREEQFMYDMLVSLDEESRAADEYMMELLEQVVEEYEEEEEMYPLDPFFPDDEYLDPGELWELSAEAYGGD